MPRDASTPRRGGLERAGETLTSIDLKPIRVRTGHQDAEGCLALVESELVAVLVRLDDPVHGNHRGEWFLEVGFGPCDGGPSSVIFRDLDEAKNWIEERLP